MHRKKIAAFALTLVTAMTVTSLPINTVFAAENSASSELLQNFQVENEIQRLSSDVTSTDAEVTIKNETADPVNAIQEAINNASEDITILLEADPESGYSEVVYKFPESLVVPENINITILGKSGVNYRLMAENSEAINTSGLCFVKVTNNGSLCMQNVTVDANQLGRAVSLLNGSSLQLKNGSVIENGYLTSQSGAGIYSYAATVTLEKGSVVKNNIIETASTSVYGAGIYSYSSTLTMEEEAKVIDNSIKSEKASVYGAGIAIHGTYGTANVKGGEISGNKITINDVNQTKSAYGAGIYAGTNNDFIMKGGLVSDNEINGSMNLACGAGIFAAGISVVSTASSITGGIITANSINCEIAKGEAGAGLYLSGSRGLAIGGNINITSNYVGDKQKNVYLLKGSLLLKEHFTEGASIGISSGQDISENVVTVVQGDSSCCLSVEDVNVFFYDNDDSSDDYYELKPDFDLNVITVGKEVAIEGGVVPIGTESELIEALANASNVKNAPTQIILNNSVEVSSTLKLAARRYVEISSADGKICSIIAGKQLDGTDTGDLFNVSGNLKLTDVTLDANQKGRVLHALSGANVTIGNNAIVKGGYAITQAGSDVNGVGIMIENGASVILEEDGIITQNTTRDPSVLDEDGNAIGSAARAMGSGVYNKGTFTMKGGTITQNGAISTNGEIGGSVNGSSNGGAIYNTGIVQITGGTISDNRVWGSGGAIYNVGENSVIEISNAVFSDNKAYMESTDNVAYTGGTGGAIYVASGTVDLGMGTVIKNNKSVNGGAIYISSSTSTILTGTKSLPGIVNLNGASIIDNTAHISRGYGGYGGGVYICNAGVFNLNDGMISGNEVVYDKTEDDLSGTAGTKGDLEYKGFGGGIYLAGGGSTGNMATSTDTVIGTPTLNMNGGVVKDNTAYNGGNGIYASNWVGSMEVSNSTSSDGNTAGYNFKKASVINVKGNPVVDDIVLAPARYLHENDWKTAEEKSNADNNASSASKHKTGYRKNIIEPVVLNIVGALEEGAQLQVSKELLSYDSQDKLYEVLYDDYEEDKTLYPGSLKYAESIEALDNVIVKGTSDYAITETDAAAIDIDILTDGLWQVGQTTLTEGEGEDALETSAITASAIEINVEVEDADFIYDGQEKKPEVIVAVGEEPLDTEAYDISYEDNVNAGTAKIILTGKGEYQGTVTKEFSIEAKELTESDVTLETTSYNYDGQAKEPAVTVKDGDAVLVDGTDYTVSYENNVKGGTASVTVTGCGNYAGTVNLSFTIKMTGAWMKNSTGYWYQYADGTYPANCWKLINGKWYHFNSAGYMQYGWQQISGKWYYLGAANDGAMKTGWQQISGKWYYLGASDDGAMKTGWQYVGGKWYYMNSSGAMQTGWLKSGGKWYYLSGSGAMQTGWVQVGSSWYYFYSDGAMAANTWVGNYYLKSSGVMARSEWVDNGRYYVDQNGVWVPGK